MNDQHKWADWVGAGWNARRQALLMPIPIGIGDARSGLTCCFMRRGALPDSSTGTAAQGGSAGRMISRSMRFRRISMLEALEPQGVGQADGRWGSLVHHEVVCSRRR